jgi:hypothetical protein
MTSSQLMAAAVGLFLVVSPACASTPGAWAELDAASLQSCMAAITKAHAAPAPGRIVLVGRIRGIGGSSGDEYYGMTFLWPTVTAAEAWLCLYDKHTKRTQAALIETATQ